VNDRSSIGHWRREPSKGKLCKCGMLRANVAFDQEAFDEIRAFAIKQKVSFSEAVRQLVQDGIETRNGA
jgi:hypothetical protein